MLRIRWVLVAALVGRCCAEAGPERLVSCDSKCQRGGCYFKGCMEKAECLGGNCTFEDCEYPSCRGGKCTFKQCKYESCGGGKCQLVDPQWIVSGAWCTGGKCQVNGEQFPSRITGHLSV